VFCTRGGLFGALVLAHLRACDRIEICAIVRSSRTFDARFGFLRGALAYLQRCGIAYSLYLFCATTLADVVCRLARIGGVPAKSRPSGPRVLTTRDVNDERGVQFLRDCSPDLIVSAFFDQRLREAVLAIPRSSCVNIHPSLLPAFRGVDPVLQMRLHGAPCMGVTVHYMTPQLDAGTVLAQKSVVVPERASVFDVTARLFSEGAALLAGVVDQVRRNERGAPQVGQASYQSWPTRADVRALHGLRTPLIRLADLRFLRRFPRPVR
jgi:methionyl-tRNA formyltransferase